LALFEGSFTRPDESKESDMRIGIVIVASAVLVLGLAGCSAANNNGVASVKQPSASSSASSNGSTKKLSTKDLVAAGIKFATCMRAHGVQMNDPKVNNGGGLQISVGGNVPKDKMDAAQKACQKYLPVQNGPSGNNPQARADLLKYSQCMRSHGVKNFPDPSADGGIQLDANKVNVDSPTFKKADKSCRPAGSRGIGEGSSGNGSGSKGGTSGGNN
jgi:hypothetical protein